MMAAAVDVSEIRGEQLFQIIRGFARKYSKRGDIDDGASDSSTSAADSRSDGHFSANESSSYKDSGDSSSEKDTCCADAARSPSSSPWLLPFRAPPGLEANGPSSYQGGGDSGSEKDVSPMGAARCPTVPWLPFRAPPGLELPTYCPSSLASSPLKVEGSPCSSSSGEPAAGCDVQAPPAALSPEATAQTSLRTPLRSSARPFESRGCLVGTPVASPCGGSTRSSPDWRFQASGATSLTPHVPSPPAPTTAPLSPQSSGETMRLHLQELQGKDHRRTLVVRRIQRLGFDSPDTLKSYFEWYGDVEAVLVSHSHVKNFRGVPATRMRPAHLGFVVMSSVEGAEAALRDGETHVVLGSPIQVQEFVPQHGEYATKAQDAE